MVARDLGRSLQRTLTHLRPPPVKGGKFAMPIPSHFRPTPRFVAVKDRIPFWHIAPNDQVVVVKGGPEVKGKSGTVERVDRETNRVWLKQADFQYKKRIASEYPGQVLSPSYTNPDAHATVARPFHIANLRLQARDAGETYTVSRMRRTAPTWDRTLHRFSWKRYGLAPGLAKKGTHAGKGWVLIPWPREDAAPMQSAGPLDAVAADAFAPTWTPSLDSLPSSDPSDSAVDNLAEELQISSLDLQGGYHSRAARTKRFNDKKWDEKEYGIQRRKDEMARRVDARDVVELDL
ncbi:hypothetical protein RQP46_009707 [Phenoliferia psychrophenolica]